MQDANLRSSISSLIVRLQFLPQMGTKWTDSSSLVHCEV